MNKINCIFLFLLLNVNILINCDPHDIKILTLGRPASIGSLFNAHTQEFTSSVLDEDEHAVITFPGSPSNQINHQKIVSTPSGVYNLLEIDLLTSFGLLTDQVKTESALIPNQVFLLKDKMTACPDYPTISVIWHKKMELHFQKLNFDDPSIETLINFDHLENSTATHVVTGISKGVAMTALFEFQNRLERSVRQSGDNLLDQFNDNFTLTNIQIHSDTPNRKFPPDLTLGQAKEYMINFGNNLQENEGHNLIYVLTPIKQFVQLIQNSTAPDPTSVPLAGIDCSYEKEYNDFIDMISALHNGFCIVDHRVKHNQEFFGNELTAHALDLTGQYKPKFTALVQFYWSQLSQPIAQSLEGQDQNHVGCQIGGIISEFSDDQDKFFHEMNSQPWGRQLEYALNKLDIVNGVTALGLPILSSRNLPPVNGDHRKYTSYLLFIKDHPEREARDVMEEIGMHGANFEQLRRLSSNQVKFYLVDCDFPLPLCANQTIPKVMKAFSSESGLRGDEINLKDFDVEEAIQHKQEMNRMREKIEDSLKNFFGNQLTLERHRINEMTKELDDLKETIRTLNSVVEGLVAKTKNQ